MSLDSIGMRKGAYQCESSRAFSLDPFAENSLDKTNIGKDAPRYGRFCKKIEKLRSNNWVESGELIYVCKITLFVKIRLNLPSGLYPRGSTYWSQIFFCPNKILYDNLGWPIDNRHAFLTWTPSIWEYFFMWEEENKRGETYVSLLASKFYYGPINALQLSRGNPQGNCLNT